MPFAFVTLDSSVATRAAYDPESRTLRVVYHDGAVVDFFDVPLLVWDELTSTSSVGRYLTHGVRNQYRFEYVQRRTNT